MFLLLLIVERNTTIIMLKKGGNVFVAGAVAAVLLATSHSFSFAPPQSQRCPALSLAEQDHDHIIQELESTNNVSDRRGFLSKIVASASASLLLSSSIPQQTNAFPDEPTRIEMSVDTEYLIRVLDYFDGDMRKALGVLIRAPSTQVEIDAPARGGGSGSINPRDAVLNALSSYNEEEYAVQQASWVKVDKPNRTLELLLKKRYTLSLPSVSSTDNAEQVEIVLKDGGTVKYKPMKLIESTSLSLSNLEAGIGLAVASYPLAYGLYNYESFREEEEKKLKKAQMTAKKAKAAAAKKAKAKGSPKKKEKKATNSVDKSKPTMKGQETKKPPIDTSTVDVNFDAASKEAEWFQSETALMSKIEDKEKEPEFEWWKNKETSPAEAATPAEVDGDSSKGTEWFGRDVSEAAVMELMQAVQQQGGYLDSLSKSQSSQAGSPPPYKRKQAATKKKNSSSFSSYLDSL